MSKLFNKFRALLATLLLLPLFTYAQNPSEIINQADNQESLLPRIYASDVKVKANDKNVIAGSFVIRNSESATVGDVQYDISLLDPLPNAPINELIADNPNVYDRQRSKDVFNLKAGESRNIKFSYQAPAVPQGQYRVRIQIVTTNDRKLGWSDASISLGGADGFFVITTQSVNVESSDPLTNQHGTVWTPLEGINVNANSSIGLTAEIYNPGTQTVTGTPTISVKRFLYKNVDPIITRGTKISLTPGTKQTITIPITTQKTPGAYIVLFTVASDTGKKISGVGEYRYVVRGQSASVASAQIKNIPSRAGELAKVDFVIAGSADRVTPVSGTMEFTIVDGQGVAGNIQKPFNIKKEAFTVKGSAEVALTRATCGTPKVVISAKNTEGRVLDSFEVAAPNFAPKSCAPAFLANNLKTVNLILAGIAIVALYIIYRIKNQSFKEMRKKSR